MPERRIVLPTLTATLIGLLPLSRGISQQPEVLEPRLHHLRLGEQVEWATFPAEAESSRLVVSFQSARNRQPWCLRLRQQDIKQAWHVTLNDREVGRLPVDENDMVIYLEIPPGTLQPGLNRLIVEPVSANATVADDVRVGEISLIPRPRSEALREATVEIHVSQAGTTTPLPCRLTVLDGSGSLQTVYAEPARKLAVRPGIVYTADGQARFQLPAGNYTVTAGRGFEYSREQRSLQIASGQTVAMEMQLRREVPTDGYVACDTHVHSLTHSGHGDATVHERMVTLAGEGIELPIATDHNVHIDHAPFAAAVGVRRYFTPVIGNEVTTRIGHFNVFPVRPGTAIPNFRLTSYAEILADIYRADGVKVAILNHARDLHGGTRPFGPKQHNALVGDNLDGWHLGFNAMEVVNSSATQSQPMQLFHDWFGLLNFGRHVTPVGSSDSHDVGRHFVGQGRTYIRCDDSDPGDIDVEQAVNNFLQSRVLVSYGLLVELVVDDKYRSGETVLAPAAEIRVKARILGPSWATADRLQLFANGLLIREWVPQQTDSRPLGVLAEKAWELARPQHDVHLVAIASGPGLSELSWPTAKPYQPTSPDWHPRTLACTGPIWLDVDGDGAGTAARQYALQLVQANDSDPLALAEALAEFDAAVAAQAAHLIGAQGADLLSDAWQSVLGDAAPAVREGFRNYLDVWRENQLAR